MPVTADTIRRLCALGLSVDQIAGVVEIMDAEDEGRRAARREGNRLRQAARRQRDAGHDGSRVTGCDAKPVTRDPSPEEKRKVSPCTPSKEKTQPSPGIPPSVPKGTSCPTATGLDLGDGQNDLTTALAEFNRMAAEVGLPMRQVLSRKHRASLHRRLAECGGLAGWRLAMDRVRASPFLRGENDRGWRAGLDFFLKPDNIAKLMEGAYDPAPAARRSTREPRPSLISAAAEVLLDHPASEFGRRARAGGYGPGGNPRGGEGIIAGMARAAERQFGRFPQQDDAVVINGTAWELAEDRSEG
ncbi:hypothetical protein [Xanthobacter autotrophicus]|uniref:hypothetical protein n=1 Tax=Xanthobacter autotrophicus TaxID=280 RepID=UPI00372B498A